MGLDERRLMRGLEPRQALRLHVNGYERVVLASAHHTLLEVLRWELDLAGAREGCGVGMCGACTVLLDGEPASSCLLLAPLAAGREITTIEGLAGVDGSLDPVQQAFVDHNAFQCSYCTPGFVLAAKALLAQRPSPAEAEVEEFLSGNLCRCGCYREIVASVMAVAEAAGAR
jgi:aerobic-type carbon monoxide dehydrogenase small subunit (CoxS/CutS family)